MSASFLPPASYGGGARRRKRVAAPERTGRDTDDPAADLVQPALEPCYARSMRVGDLRTPAALVDIDALERNAARMGATAARLGVRLRPHVKTHKTLEAARIQVRGQFGGITVSTLAEAAFFAAGGFSDITYAVPVAPAKVAEAAEIASGLSRLNLLVDHTDAAAAVETCARDRGLRSVGVPQGGLRLPPRRRRSGTDARASRSQPAWRPRRTSIFAAFSPTPASRTTARASDEIRPIAAHERDVMTAFAGRLRAAGVRVEEVSVGSTPTLAVAGDLGGVTEVRPGNYAFFDATQSGDRKLRRSTTWRSRCWSR